VADGSSETIRRRLPVAGSWPWSLTGARSFVVGARARRR
jgi:hypothetical protein